MMSGIHRRVERNAATQPDATAIIDGDRRCSYRELNATANLLARRLMSQGLRRGHHAYVRMKPSIELATTLLAIVKAGAAYTLVEHEVPRSQVPEGISIRGGEGVDLRCLGVVPIEPAACSPNLPVITRPTDLACVLENGGDTPLLVPHATIASLKPHGVVRHAPWTGEQGAFGLWIALMNGSVAVVDERRAVAAA